MQPKGHMEPIDILLFAGMMIFSVIIVVCNIIFPMDGQIFQVFSGILGGFAGAFFARLKTSTHPEEQRPDPAQAPSGEPQK